MPAEKTNSGGSPSVKSAASPAKKRGGIQSSLLSPQDNNDSRAKKDDSKLNLDEIEQELSDMGKSRKTKEGGHTSSDSHTGIGSTSENTSIQEYKLFNHKKKQNRMSAVKNKKQLYDDPVAEELEILYEKGKDSKARKQALEKRREKRSLLIFGCANM